MDVDPDEITDLLSFEYDGLVHQLAHEMAIPQVYKNTDRYQDRISRKSMLNPPLLDDGTNIADVPEDI